MIRDTPRTGSVHADSGVDTLCGVGRVNDLMDGVVKLLERHELGPGIGLDPDDRGIAFLLFVTELCEPFERGLILPDRAGRGSKWPLVLWTR